MIVYNREACFLEKDSSERVCVDCSAGLADLTTAKPQKLQILVSHIRNIATVPCRCPTCTQYDVASYVGAYHLNTFLCAPINIDRCGAICRVDMGPPMVSMLWSPYRRCIRTTLFGNRETFLVVGTYFYVHLYIFICMYICHIKCIHIYMYTLISSCIFV